MKIHVEGDPGTGNTYMEINIQHVENFNPAATSIINNYYGTRSRHQDSASQITDAVDRARKQSEILSYVSRIGKCLDYAWTGSYEKTWVSILDMEAVSVLVYNPGKQQGTSFNRSLVANIIHYLHGRGIYTGEYNASHLAEILEGDKDHSVRCALGTDPEPHIVSCLNRQFEQ